MSKTLKLEQELELAKLMIKDLEKLWKSYAKKAYENMLDRETKQAKKGFLEYQSKDELIEVWGHGDIDEDTYNRGLDYFDNPPKPVLSLVELHRKNIKEILDRWRGTVKEIEEELSPPVPKENVFEKLEREEREERYKTLMARDI